MTPPDPLDLMVSGPVTFAPISSRLRSTALSACKLKSMPIPAPEKSKLPLPVTLPPPFDMPLRLESTSFEPPRSEEHTSELQSLMRISYAVFCLKKKKHSKEHAHNILHHSSNM